MFDKQIDQLISEQGLPTQFRENVSQWYAPIAMEIAGKARQVNGALLVGVQGSQGSGKSTLATFLKALLEGAHQLNTAVLSIDDFYLTRAERTQLSQSVHPLLSTRGVPGTHDVTLAQKTITALNQLKKGQSTRIPRFDKSIDDRATETEWPKIDGPVDVVLLEGWCVGLDPEEEHALDTAVNTLETEKDAERIWRNYVNQHLADEYAALFTRIAFFVVLQAPSFDAVYRWRLMQEEKLIAKTKTQALSKGTVRTMSANEIRTFISHYQRLTEHGLRTLPKKADYVLYLDAEHRILKSHTKNRTAE